MALLTFQCVEWNSSTIQKNKIKYKECCNISSCFQNFRGHKSSRSTVCVGKILIWMENILTEEKLSTIGMETIT